MKNILYIGNKLEGKGKTATTIDTLGPLLQREGYRLRYASSIQNRSKRMLHMMRTTYRSRKWADVVLIDTYSTRNFWYAVVISRICKVLQMNYIPILHGGNLPDRLHKNPKLIAAFINNAHAVVCPSDYLSVAFEEAGYHKIIKINNFIELENYPFLKRTALQPKLLWVRSFAQIYNPQMAIHVLKKLQETYPDASLTMIGPEKDGSQESCKIQAKELKLEVNFTGLLSKKIWVDLSEQHDIFINTTGFDNLPVSLIEAMALGLPVVSTNVGGIPYLIENDLNGMLVPYDDVEKMAGSIDYLISHPIETARIVAKARETIEPYSWSQVSQQWNSVLQS
ncbi:MAG: glycosyltransferase involved in cell wall biosynthesis [Rubritalea sp.]|jgi:glycosyltransferase involved in cell wall biosynthesis